MSAARSAARGLDAFGLDLARALEGAPGNLVLSPVSVGLALAVTWAGARGETAAQIGRALRLAEPRAAALEHLAALTTELTRARGRTELHVATRLFASKRSGVSPAFQDLGRRVFGTACEGIDFASDPERARAQINAWTATATRDRVRELLPPRSLDEETRLVLASAVYLKALWAEPFEASMTASGPFYTGAEVRQVQKMVGTKHAARLSITPGLRAVELPYADGATSLLIVVPDDDERFRALGRELSPELLDEVTAGLSEGSLLLHLPKIDTSEGAAVSLSDALRVLGIEDVLDRTRADLRTIADPVDADDRLCVAEAYHQASLRLDEEGTEAAAATAIVFGPFGGPTEPPLDFDIDRPFYLFVRDTSSGATLFFGKIRELPARA